MIHAKPILRGLALALFLPLAGVTASAPNMAAAQGLFDPVIKVNGAAVTRYELDQRAKLLTLLRAPADPAKLARQQLIEDRLKAEAAIATGVSIDDAQLRAGMEQFAAQGSLDADQLLALLARGGVSEETFREFVRSGLIWREVTQARFGPRVSVSEEDLERARAAITDGTGVRVLLSEIIIPFEVEGEEAAMARARRISELTSTAAFSAQARQVSATRTRDAGGQLPWQPITQLPPVLRPLVLGLAPGEVTDPLPLQGAVALFQMRDIQETDVATPDYAAIEYAAYYIPGGRSADAIARAAQIDAQTDTCDDLYGIAKGQPESVLERGTKAPGEIPDDIAISLSRLDPGEVSYDVTRAGGQTLVLLMMCGRSQTITAETPEAPADGTAIDAAPAEGAAAAPDETAQLSAQIANRRLESFANGYLEQLRSEARIIEY
ncbi:peptidylprolyl isomerase [Pelagivirga sediminicola]|nr:peptidylprolyl isomerase [Pelagivirga sediminicola]